jgi:hypothetical protein
VFEETVADSRSKVKSVDVLRDMPAFLRGFYIYVPLKKRLVGIDGKNFVRAIRALFGGIGPVVTGAILAIPYEHQDGEFALYPAPCSRGHHKISFSAAQVPTQVR